MKHGIDYVSPITKKRAENKTHRGVFLTNFEVFRNVVNTWSVELKTKEKQKLFVTLV